MRGFLLMVAALGLHACFVAVDDFPVGTAQIGEACDSERLCAPGLDCWGADREPLGAPGGVCTVFCDSAPCPEGSSCVEVGAASGSTRACVIGCPHGSEDASKCRGRRELGCNKDGVCLPVCSSDAQCPSRFCDRETGLCSDAPSTGSLPPASCGAETECRGECVSGAGDLGVCTERCVLGAPSACTGEGAEVLTCVDLLGTGADIGDIGYCARSCCPGPCLQTPFLCNLSFGGKSYCGPPTSLGVNCLDN
jgi:hypothetical protein